MICRFLSKKSSGVYIPGTQMTLVLIGKDLVFGGLTFKNRGHLGSRLFYKNRLVQVLRKKRQGRGGTRHPKPPKPSCNLEWKSVNPGYPANTRDLMLCFDGM